MLPRSSAVAAVVAAVACDGDAGTRRARDAGAGAADAGAADEGVPDAAAADAAASACPIAIEAGRNRGFPVGRDEREFVIDLPEGYDPARRWPVVFLWHWLGGSADQMRGAWAFGWDAAADAIVVAPESRDDAEFEWELAVDDPERNPDVRLFDALLDCLVAEHGADPDRVYATGMSAGGLWTATLAMLRAERLAAFAPASGGLVVPWRAPEARPPGLVIWGGPDDQAVLDFERQARDLIADLRDNGQTVVACDHGEGHTWPAGTGAYVHRFFLDHPRGADPDPYLDGLPDAFPDYCRLEE